MIMKVGLRKSNQQVKGIPNFQPYEPFANPHRDFIEERYNKIRNARPDLKLLIHD